MKNKIQFWTFSLVVFILLRFISNSLIEKFIGIDYGNPLTDRLLNIFIKLLIVSVFIPLFETFLYFYLPYVILKYFFEKKENIIYPIFFIVSTCLFSLDHRYNISYLINALVAGALYSIFYIIYLKKNMNPFWCIMLLHSFYNLFVLANEYMN